MASTSTLLGAAGEHYVMYELLRRNYIAALAPQGAPNLDIIVADSDGRKLCGIQVKTRSGRGGDGGWHMRPKHETLKHPQMFYCFVDFGHAEVERPTTYVLPSATVAQVIYASHRAWLQGQGHNGHQRQDSTVRRLLPNYRYAFGEQFNPYPMGWLDPYKEAWDSLSVMQSEEERA